MFIERGVVQEGTKEGPKEEVMRRRMTDEGETTSDKNTPGSLAKYKKCCGKAA